MLSARLSSVLIRFALVMLLGVSTVSGPALATDDDRPTGQSGRRAEPEDDEDQTPASRPASPAVVAANDPAPVGLPNVSDITIATPGNNIIGINVARLRRDRYVAAAAELANANGGDWGYLTVVFTAQERDSASGEALLQELLDRSFEYHLQPIVRVATRFDIGAEIWSRPEDDDPVRWRAFLDKGRWPTRQVWVIAGNEPNLGREWGGEVDAAGYARYLDSFLHAFADSERFRIVNGPLDASNGTELPRMQDAYEFLGEMEAEVPGIFTRLHGWASNPYRVLAGDGLRYTHLAYEAELQAIGRDMPVLITEAGHLDTGDAREIAEFYAEAFRDWMADSRVVAVTPLFWHPDRGEYWMFDFDQHDRIVSKSPTYELIQRLPRTRGTPDYSASMPNVARAGAASASALRSQQHGSRTQDARAADPPAAPIRFRVANTDGQGVRLRAEPWRTSRSLQTLREGTGVEAVGPEHQQDGLVWRPVKTADGIEGWVAQEFLSPSGGAD